MRVLRSRRIYATEKSQKLLFRKQMFSSCLVLHQVTCRSMSPVLVLKGNAKRKADGYWLPFRLGGVVFECSATSFTF